MTAAPTGGTPSWLLQREVGLCPCGCIGVRRKRGFVAKTLEGSAAVLQQALFAEEVARRDGLLQRLEPRVKLVTLLGLLIAVSLVHRLPVLVVAYLGTVALAALSRVELAFFLKRVWLFIPIFTGVIVLPATLDVITPGHVVVPLGTWFGHHLGVTSPGLRAAALLVARVATSVSLVVLLTLTTPWTRLLASLRALLVPRMFLQVLGMAHRYLFHLLASVTDMYTARRARTPGRDRGGRSGRAFVTASAGALFGKTHALAEEVHQAMVSRGYTGDARTLDATTVRRVDVVWYAAVVLAVAAVVWLGRVA